MFCAELATYWSRGSTLTNSSPSGKFSLASRMSEMRALGGWPMWGHCRTIAAIWPWAFIFITKQPPRRASGSERRPNRPRTGRAGSRPRSSRWRWAAGRCGAISSSLRSGARSRRAGWFSGPTGAQTRVDAPTRELRLGELVVSLCSFFAQMRGDYPGAEGLRAAAYSTGSQARNGTTGSSVLAPRLVTSTARIARGATRP